MKTREVGKRRRPRSAVISIRVDNLNLEINGLSRKALCQ